MRSEELWNKFVKASGIDENTEYSAYAFGDDADKLAELVKQGIKTATSSAAVLYQIEGEPLPKVGEYSVILDSEENAVCIIKNTKVYITKYADVTADHAYKEGEGDRSLRQWREVHKTFFTREYEAYCMKFDENEDIVCEEFCVVFEKTGKIMEKS